MKYNKLFVIGYLFISIGVFAQPKNHIDMIEVSGGIYQMGSVGNEAFRQDNETIHEVEVSGFYISKYEVTQELYKVVMGKNPSNAQGDVKKPVERVSWYDSVEFCNRLSANDNLQPVYTINGKDVTWNKKANGYRLPTEAEWEYAAKGGVKKSTFVYSGSDNVLDVAWVNVECENGSQPLCEREVGTKKPNELGIYDMSGNVWEWCWDWYGEYPENKTINPVGPDTGSLKVCRGGSWNLPFFLARITARSNTEPESNGGHRGFRVVRNRT